MIKVPVFTLDKKEKSTLELNEEVFGVEVNLHLIHRVLKWYFTNTKKHTASTKTRAEVSGGGRKPWRQKGTGRARVGSIRSPLWRHGGVIFGPKPREVKDLLPIKERKKAIKMILSNLVKNNSLIVLDDDEKLPEKTKNAKEILTKFGINGEKILMITGEKSVRGFTNFKNVMIIKNPVFFDFGSYVKCERLITFPGIIKKIEELLLK